MDVKLYFQNTKITKEVNNDRVICDKSSPSHVMYWQSVMLKDPQGQDQSIMSQRDEDDCVQF